MRCSLAERPADEVSSKFLDETRAVLHMPIIGYGTKNINHITLLGSLFNRGS